MAYVHARFIPALPRPEHFPSLYAGTPPQVNACFLARFHFNFSTHSWVKTSGFSNYKTVISLSAEEPKNPLYNLVGKYTGVLYVNTHGALSLPKRELALRIAQVIR
jgi:hypothetical protein